ncbi:hypothetical protein ACFQ1S_07320, partial [Kibdelosporangium lantanae]
RHRRQVADGQGVDLVLGEQGVYVVERDPVGEVGAGLPDTIRIVATSTPSALSGVDSTFGPWLARRVWTSPSPRSRDT